MHDRWRRDGHLRHEPRVGLKEPEMTKHGMVGRKVELAGHLEPLRLSLGSVELDAVIEHNPLATLKMPKEIEVPPRTTKLTVGGKLQTYLLLLGKDVGDFLVLDPLQLNGSDLALLAFVAGFLECRRAQKATDHVRAEWWCGRGHKPLSLGTVDAPPQLNGGGLAGVTCRSVTPKCISSRSGSPTRVALSPANTMRPRSSITARSVKPR